MSFSLPYLYSLARLSICLKMPETTLWVHFLTRGPANPCAYNNTLLNCFPGSCRTSPFISNSKRVARTSLEFNPLVSTMPSMARGFSRLERS